jgi:hypothetical protein
MSREHGRDLGITGELTASRFGERFFEVRALLGAERVRRSRQSVHVLECLGCSVLTISRPSLCSFDGFLKSL